MTLASDFPVSATFQQRRGMCRPVSANKLDSSVAANYDVKMDNQTGKNAVHETQRRPRIERKPLAQVWADYIALDHNPKAEFNPARATPMQQERDRGNRGSR